MSKKRILVTPLNWGLGHATRCIPILEALEKNSFEPVIASDGNALALLKKEFPHLQALELPSYNIEYAQNGENFKWKLFRQLPKLITAVRAERKIVRKWVTELQLDGIISDNRLGIHSAKVPSVFITHQLNVLTGNTSWLSTKMHHYFIKKFAECWVPDNAKKPNLSGKLGHLKDNSTLNIKHLGPLSRFRKKPTEKIYDLMVVLSGPEPQRTLLETKLKDELQHYDGSIIFIRGVVEPEQQITREGKLTYYNFMTSDQLEWTFNQSKMVVSRSGYTTIMDLAKLGKKAFFIPTPGQYEQEYLAKKLKKKGLVPYCKQDDFRVERLLEVDLYKGLKETGKNETDWNQLFTVFT
ncbi:glycosyltransferase [Flavobacterium suncheonense]|uniref:Glycosyltransferase n=1 Tax=Flavobacterium suncheonense GH29-5 = DSM 17707 TaxID=1121899 RepID=A0A0A2MFU4_9FLAO|nr:glycosyltransferase [Flavobacterium suncheonense]KGO90481.1 glycosyltransferase [Flavobacterium suncheonense GH29-5 = DSM 17707]